MANYLIKRNSILKWMDRNTSLYDIVTKYNLDYFSPNQLALKIGGKSAWLEFRERHHTESIREFTPQR